MGAFVAALIPAMFDPKADFDTDFMKLANRALEFVEKGMPFPS
jgi:hypothetical protein